MPHEGPRRLIRDGQVPLDGHHELACAAMHTAANLFRGEFDKPALDEIEPRRVRGVKWT